MTTAATPAYKPGDQLDVRIEKIVAGGHGLAFADGLTLFVDLAAVGDRVQIRNGRTSGNLVVLDVVQAGASDPLCCPGELVTRAWRRDGSALREEPAIATGRLSLSILAGDTWTLRNWDLDTPATAVPR